MNDFWRNKKILVTGASGFLGKHLVGNLLRRRRIPKANLFLPPSQALDLREWKDCKSAVKNQDIVIHLAAVTGDSEFHRLNPGKIFYDNIVMGVQLMEAARREGVEKFVGIGSVTSYPKTASLPLKESELWRGYPEALHAPYSFAKKILLVQAQAYREQYSFRAVNLLLTNLYGPGMSLENGCVTASLIQKIDAAKKSKKKFIEVWGTGRQTRNFLYVEDAADGILLATERYESPEPVNVGSDQEVSIKDLASNLCRLMKFEGEICWDTSKPEGRLRTRLDVSRAKKEFGFDPKITLEEGLLKTIRWYNTLRA
jgi:GDP-L-fucose synthase